MVGFAVYSAPSRIANSAIEQDHFVQHAGVLVAAVAAACLTLLLFLAFFAEPRHAVIDAHSIKEARSSVYVAPIELSIRWPLRVATLSGWSNLPGSALTMTENGKQFGHYETDSRELARKGGGRYGFYMDRLVFSTPDGSDPRVNGRIYAWKLPLMVDPAAWLSLLIMVAVGVLLGTKNSIPRAIVWLASNQQHRKATFMSHAGELAWLVSFVALASSVAAYLVMFRWGEGPSGYLSLKGYLPVSDAHGYFSCAVAASGLGDLAAQQLPGHWCTRRVVYPAVLGSLLGLSGWRPQSVLLIQAVVIGCAIAALTSLVARVFSRAAALIALVGLFIFAYEFAIGTFMTEGLGLPLGLVGLALLFAYAAGNRQVSVLYSGLALFSIGMFARMGALLMLPIVGLWACVILFLTYHKRRGLLCIGALICVVAGPILQVLLIVAFGVDATNTGGNYATTLYGLSTGSRDWSQAYRDFAPLFQSSSETAAFAKVFEAAMANIRENPAVLLHSLRQNAESYAFNLFAFGLPMPWYSNNALTALFVVGMVWCLVRLRDAPATLLLGLCVGEFISIPLVFTTVGDHRVLATSVAVRLVTAGVGLSWLINLGLAFLKLLPVDSSGTKFNGTRPGVILAFGIGAVLVSLALLPVTPVRRLFALPTLEGRGCPAGQQEVVARVGRESMAMLIGSPASPLRDRALGVSPNQLEADQVRRQAWWAKGMPELREGTMLIYAIQLMPAARGSFVHLIFEGELPGDSAGVLSFCYDPNPTSIDLGEWLFRRALSMRSVPEAK
jgi:hypothetical protein